MPPSLEDILLKLREKARPDQLNGMARFGIRGEKRLGISVPDLRRLARDIGKNHELALHLWDSGIEDARILASMVEEPEWVSKKQLEKWVQEFNSWDVCDQVCMNLFDRIPGIHMKVAEWAQRDEEFVRRAAFSLMAIFCVHDKKAPDEFFVGFFPLIIQGALDERNYVRKAVSWALRNIGKRNLILNRKAQDVALEIQHQNTKSSRWVASDVLRELRDEKVLRKIERKSVR